MFFIDMYVEGKDNKDILSATIIRSHKLMNQALAESCLTIHKLKKNVIGK